MQTSIVVFACIFSLVLLVSISPVDADRKTLRKLKKIVDILEDKSVRKKVKKILKRIPHMNKKIYAIPCPFPLPIP